MNKSELLVGAKPILFNTEMVKAILDGRKSCTRRVIKPQPTGKLKIVFCTETTSRKCSVIGCCCFGDTYFDNLTYAKPKYSVGDILYVRETWAKQFGIYWYKAAEYTHNEQPPEKWKPSIHMPKEAARIFLRVTGVRSERLQDITSEQIDKEGCKEYAYSATTGELLPSTSVWFKIIWDKTIKKSDIDEYSWSANPWVWVYEFEMVNAND